MLAQWPDQGGLADDSRCRGNGVTEAQPAEATPATTDLSDVPIETIGRLLALTRRLTERRNMDELLQDVIQGSTSLVSGADFVCVLRYDPDGQVLAPAAGVGFDLGVLLPLRLRPGESMTGQAFLTGRPLLLPNPRDVRLAQATLQPENDRLIRIATGRVGNRIRSALSVPLMAGDRRIGVLVIDNYDTDRDFTSADLAVATSIADHAAAAMLNVEDYREARALSGELSRTISLQRRLISSMMSPTGSLESLLRNLFGILRRPMRVDDREGRTVGSIGGSIATATTLPIRTSGVDLGVLVVEGRVTSSDQVALSQALPLIALEFMKREAQRQERLRSYSEAFRSLWEGNPNSMRDLLATRSAGTQIRMVILTCADSTLVAKTFLWLFRHRWPFTQVRGDLLILVTEPQFDSLRSLLGSDGTLIVGEPCRTEGDWCSVLRGLVLLQVCAARYGSPTLTREVALADYPEMKVVAMLPQQFKETFTRQIIAPIASDQLLCETLRTWIFADRSFKDAGARLRAHPNTVRYRIEKAAALLERSLQDDRTALAVRLAFLAQLDCDLE